MPMPLLAPDLKASKVTVPMPSMQFGPDPQVLACPYCHAQIRSEVKSKATLKTHLTALLLCCCLLWPCVCLPYCMKSCQNRNHMCPNCQAYLGSYGN